MMSNITIHEGTDYLTVRLDALDVFHIQNPTDDVRDMIDILVANANVGARLQHALTPSPMTKCAYIGEIKQDIEMVDEEGNERMFTRTLPWTTIKDVMRMIRKYGGLND